MTIEDRLRQAIEARTAQVGTSSDDGLVRIEDKLAQAGGPQKRPPTVWLLAAAAVLLVAAAVGGLVVADRDSGSDVETVDEPSRPEPSPPETPDTSEAEAPTTTEARGGSDTTTPTTAPPEPSGPPEDVLAQAVWPRPSSDVRFDQPAAAARSFALYLAQFENPVVGEFRAGDSRSGEVPVRPTSTGPETTVLVRQLSDDHWYVVGSVTDDITLDQPASGAALASPQSLSGRALAFEGTVQVKLLGYLPDGRSEQLGSTSVTGGGGPAAPFSGRLDWAPGSADLEPLGVLVLWTADESGDAGGAWEVVAVPVGLRD